MPWQREIGVSIISFFPGFFLPGGYRKIARTLNDLELGVQLLPLRGLQERHLEILNVLSYEGPWNCGSIFSALKRSVGMQGEYPSLIDIGLFGSEAACRARVRMINLTCPEALPIDTPWTDGSAIELSPDMYKGNARNWEVRPSGVVLDTYHWERLGARAERELLCLGGISAVRMVHLKLMSTQDTLDFLAGRGSAVSLLKEFLAHDVRNVVPVIIEAKNDALVPGLNWQGFAPVTQTLAKIRDKVREVTA